MKMVWRVFMRCIFAKVRFLVVAVISPKCQPQLAGRKVVFKYHPRGNRARYLKLAQTNAKTALTSKLNHKMTIQERFFELQQALSLKPISRMECFDISHTMGEKTVASCVVFNQDGPYKPDYRRYNITGITGIFIDGGRGQLSRAYDVVKPYMEDWPKRPLMIGVAKGTTRKPGLETLIFITGEEFSLPSDSPALHLIQHIRDESHNHAISGHRAQRAKVRKRSALEDIEGVGPKRRQALLKYMGGLQELKRASKEEIAKVPGISLALAEKIVDALHHS